MKQEFKERYEYKTEKGITYRRLIEAYEVDSSGRVDWDVKNGIVLEATIIERAHQREMVNGLSEFMRQLKAITEWHQFTNNLNIEIRSSKLH